jgi:perosamine synthetase
MLSLLPAEYWDCSFADLIHGFVTALSLRHRAPRSDIRIPELGPSLAVRSARTAIFVALKALGLPARASVGVPLYCCPIVLSAVRAAGCRPRFIDVDPDTYCLSAADLAAKSSEVDAVIAVHMFGNVCDMSRLRKAAPNKPFIEDCAQALGSRLDGRVAGSFGEIAVFSFRSGKYLSVGEGGAIHCGDADLVSLLTQLIAALPAPSRADECVHVAATYLRSRLRSKPLWGMIGARLWDAHNRKSDRTSPARLLTGQAYETDRNLAARRLPLLACYVERQRTNAGYYSRNLVVAPDMLCPETPGAFFNRLQFPLLIPTQSQCERLAARLREDQISTSRPYRNIVAVAAEHYHYTGDCPNAERIASRVLVIPCHHALKPADLERTAFCVNRAWAGISGRREALGMSSIQAAPRTASSCE